MEKNLVSVNESSLTGIGAVLATILSLIGFLVLGIATGLPILSIGGISLILAFVFLSLILGIAYFFGVSYLYNCLIKKLKDVNVEITEEGNVNKVSVVSYALIVAVIQAIVAFIVTPIFIQVTTIVAQFSYITLLMSGAAEQAQSMFLIVSLLINPLNIVLIPVMVFIGTFAFLAIGATVYNLISPKIGGLKLTLSEYAHSTQIDSINPLSTSLIFSIIGLIFGVIISIILAIFMVANG
ncbi:MAG: hypothetical protein ACRC1M_00405, partial [Methanobacteriaceae archaeon]